MKFAVFISQNWLHIGSIIWVKVVPSAKVGVKQITIPLLEAEFSESDNAVGALNKCTR